MSDDVRAAARRIIEEVINRGDLEAFDELVAESYVDHTGVPDRDTYRELILQSRAAFPDLHLSIEDEVVEGERWNVTDVAGLLEQIGALPAELGGGEG